MRHVRQPLRPLPARGSTPRRDDGETRVVGPVPGHVLGDQGPGEIEHRSGVGVGFEPDRRRGAGVHGNRQVVHGGPAAQEPAQRQRGQRLQCLHRTGVRGGEPGGEQLGAAPGAQPAEVVVARAALPQPVRGEHVRPGGRVGVDGLQGVPLLVRDRTGAVAQHVEVAQVVAAVLVHRRGARTGTAAAPGQHAQRGQREHPAEQPGARVPPAEHDEQQRPADHRQRQQPRHEAAGDRTLRFRWWFEHELAAGQLGHRAPRTPHPDRSRHRRASRSRFSRTPTAAPGPSDTRSRPGPAGAVRRDLSGSRS